jgi:uncharacterized membrane protein
MKPIHYLYLASLALSALMAGLFFAYSVSVMPGLAKVGDRAFLSAMQSINREIQNGLFFTCFFGLLLVLPAHLAIDFRMPEVRKMLLVATAAYAVLVFGVTVAGNVPLNDRLDHLDLARASAETLSQYRRMFERRWTLLNHLRTVGSLVSFLALAAAALSKMTQDVRN